MYISRQQHNGSRIEKKIGEGELGESAHGEKDGRNTEKGEEVEVKRDESSWTDAAADRSKRRGGGIISSRPDNIFGEEAEGECVCLCGDARLTAE